jgi:hypothetical protein
MSLAILAYGSLKDDPGLELAPLIRDRKPIQTPFRVEYGRASDRRRGAPTLIPMDCGGPVQATLLILDPSVSTAEAIDMLWRRETRNKQGRYNPPARPTNNHVIIDKHRDLGGIALVLSTRIGTNITPLTPEELARRAIDSARSADVPTGDDGISYLHRAKSSGVETPLTAAYERAVLRQTGTNSLKEAIAIIRPRHGGI